MATYAAASPVGGSRESLPGAAATVLTPGECTCNNIGMDGGIVLTATAANHYYTHLPSSAACNHVDDYVNQRTTSTV